nr:oleosin 1-like [Ipomoea trifida]GMC65765.1 oleosin 1-like [Ipomoea batatas]
MAAERYGQNRDDSLQLNQQQQQPPKSYGAVKTATAATVGGSLLVLSGLTLAGTVIALTVATPLFVIFSPVLLPAAITAFLLITGFLSSGGFGLAAISVLSWMYQYMTGKRPPGAEQLDYAKGQLGIRAREMMRDKGDNYNVQPQVTTTATA